jgi:hypothetical protein
VDVRFIARRTVRSKGKKYPTDKNTKRVFDKRKNIFVDVCVDKAADFKSPPMKRQIVEDFAHAETPTKEVKVEAADLSELAIEGRKAASVGVVGVALFIKSEEAKGEIEVAL